MARVVAEGMPHHITQRGNRRQATFFSDDDYQAYIDLMAEWCGTYDVEIWAYCLMPNHIHLIAVPGKAENLRLAIGEAQTEEEEDTDHDDDTPEATASKGSPDK